MREGEKKRARMGSEFGEKEKGILWVGGRGERVSGDKEGKVWVGNKEKLWMWKGNG